MFALDTSGDMPVAITAIRKTIAALVSSRINGTGPSHGNG